MIKYPRTPHLPWSPGASDDDIYTGVHALEGREIIVTEKMDGENTTLYRAHMHARSLDSKHHPSRSWVKALQQEIGHLIPEGWRICGENLYAKHSLGYENLPSYFLMFSIWDEHNRCLSWDDTLEWAQLLNLETPPVLYQGLWDEAFLRDLVVDTDKQEGYVVRDAGSFAFEDFGSCVAKWVRPSHVQTDTHWMNQPVIPNGVKR